MEATEQPQPTPALISAGKFRAPLVSQTNSPPRTPAPSQSNRIWRKPSLTGRCDSSEELPTSHDSIFQAECVSSTNSEDNGITSERWPSFTLSPIIGLASSLSVGGFSENRGRELLLPTIGNTPILYGHGTALSTIVEQNSSTTIRTKNSLIYQNSASNLSLPLKSTSHLLGHRDSFDLPSSVTLRPPRRRKSFSADDLLLIKRFYHDACTMIEGGTDQSLQIHDIYAEPLTPLVSPIERPSTPPGMPSWTAAQSIRPLQARPVRASPNRLQRLLGLEPSRVGPTVRTTVSFSAQQHNHSNPHALSPRSSSSPTSRRIPPTFRPPRSGHGTGPLNAHPFIRAERADVKSELQPNALPTRPATSGPSSQPSPGHPSLRAAGRGPRMANLRACFTTSAPIRPTFRGPQMSYTVRPPNPTHAAPAAKTTQCPHRRGRSVTLSSLRQDPDQILQSDAIRANADNSPLLATTDVTLINVQSTEPLMSGAIAGPAMPRPPTIPKSPAVQCWKCRASALFTQIDVAWEASTRWCCWVFCGVDIDDDGDDDHYGLLRAGRMEGVGSGNGSGLLLGPRRVTLAETAG